MSEASGALPAPAAEVGALARVPGVLFTPGKTFDSIARKPTWLAPLLLWTAASFSAVALLLPRIDFERMTRERLERAGQTISQERIQAIAEQQKRLAPVLSYIGAGVGPLVTCLIVAVVCWGALKAFGWDLTFRQGFGVTAHAFVPGILGAALLLPILASRESVNPDAMGDLLRSNPGFLVDRSSSKAGHSLLQSMDVFSFWTLALLAIGFASAAKVSRKAAAAVILTIWAGYVLGKAGLAALF